MSKSKDLQAPATVTRALLQLVANAGNVAKTAKEVGVPESTLRSWKNDLHSEQYRRLEEDHGRELELQAADQARQTIVRAGEIERELLERARQAQSDMVPQALRAVTDVKAKNVDRLLSLTGRPVQPRDSDGNDLIGLVKSMVDRGYVRVVAGVQLDAPPEKETP